MSDTAPVDTFSSASFALAFTTLVAVVPEIGVPVGVGEGDGVGDGTGVGTGVPMLKLSIICPWVQEMSSTLAGNLTITGSIANIIVVERAAAERVHVGFREYARVGVPVTVATLLIGSLWLWVTG